MKIDDLISHFEADYAEYLAGLLTRQLLSYVPTWLLGYTAWFLNPIVGFLMGLATKKAVKYIDLGAYAIFKGTLNEGQALKYERSAIDYDEAAETGDEDAIAAAKARKRADFIAFFNLSN